MCGGGWSAGAKVLVVWRYGFRFLPFLFVFAVEAPGLEFCTSVFVVGGRQVGGVLVAFCCYCYCY